MSNPETLRTAIQAARAGRREEARDLFLEIVEEDPRNETAWIWLSGLVDSLEDRIIACENVLTLNPRNVDVRAYLAKLQRESRGASTRTNMEEAAHLLELARDRTGSNEIEAALQYARQALEKDDSSEDAWLLVGRYSLDIDEQIAAFSRAYQLNPSNTETAAALEQARLLALNPLSAAEQLEHSGNLEEALKVYQDLAARAGNSQEFDHIYRQILRIEALQRENIRHIGPASAIIRLTFSWPLLYISLALVQVGLNPFAHPALYLWLGLPFVILGTFLLSLAEVRSMHFFLQTLFGMHGDASTFLRLAAMAAGWFLIVVPHVLLILDSLARLQRFKVPPIPS